MPIAPPDACKTCGGSYWVISFCDSWMDDEDCFWDDCEEIPCPACNESGLHPKVYY